MALKSAGSTNSINAIAPAASSTSQRNGASSPTLNASTRNPWILHLQPNSKAKMRLFCFHHSGSGASMFLPWVDRLPDTIEICPIQLPGHEERAKEPLHSNLSSLLSELTPAILPHLDMPFAFFGHSMGALVSFELARQLQRQGAPQPVQLFVSSLCAPHRLPSLGLWVHESSDSVLLETLHHRYGSVPEELRQNTALIQRVLPIVRADVELCETYRYVNDTLLDCPISAFGGLHDPTVTPHELRAWSELTNGNCSTQLFPGNHFFFIQDPDSLLHVIYSDLKQFCLL